MIREQWRGGGGWHRRLEQGKGETKEEDNLRPFPFKEAPRVSPTAGIASKTAPGA
jgi:hypothetical protein